MQRSACQRQAAARGRDSARRLLRALSAERLEPRNLLAISAQLLADINLGGGESAAGGYEVVGNTAFFSANDGVSGRELWKTDGTAAGTALVRDIVPGPAESFPRFLTNVGGTLFFVAPDPATGEHFQLWKSNGTAAGTVRVSDLDLGRIGGAAPELANVNGTLLFRAGDAAAGAELWKSDGTTAGTVLVSDIAAGELGSDPRYLTNVNGTLFFRASSTEGRAELWKSDGTATGTVLVQDLGLGNNTAGPKQLTNVNGTLFFTAFGDVFGGQLWKSDGTTAGTVIVKDAGIGGIANIGGLTNVGGTLFFSAHDGVYGQELWKSDGTFAGTVIVRDLNVERGAYPWSLTNVGGTLFFTALVDGPAAGFVIGKSDGTAPGTRVVEHTDAAMLTDVRGTLFFSDVDRLLASGGVAGDLLEIVGPEGATPTTIYGLVNLNGRLLFTADDGVHGAELWSVVTVNEAPSFVKGADQQATDSGGPRAIDNWATALSAGPFYESWQQLSFSVVAENSALFAVQPAIDGTGRLTFAPLPNASGSTLVTVVLSDSGGTAGGGMDASPPQTFTITITKPNPLQNTWQPLDTSGDGEVSALDAVLVINLLNSPSQDVLPATVGAEGEAAVHVYYDVSGDGFTSPLDAVLVINHLNANSDVEASGGEADSLAAAAPSGPTDARDFALLLDLLASDTSVHKARRRLRA